MNSPAECIPNHIYRREDIQECIARVSFLPFDLDDMEPTLDEEIEMEFILESWRTADGLKRGNHELLLHS